MNLIEKKQRNESFCLIIAFVLEHEMGSESRSCGDSRVAIRDEKAQAGRPMMGGLESCW